MFDTIMIIFKVDYIVTWKKKKVNYKRFWDWIKVHCGSNGGVSITTKRKMRMFPASFVQLIISTENLG